MFFHLTNERIIKLWGYRKKQIWTLVHLLFATFCRFYHFLILFALLLVFETLKYALKVKLHRQKLSILAYFGSCVLHETLILAQDFSLTKMLAV